MQVSIVLDNGLTPKMWHTISKEIRAQVYDGNKARGTNAALDILAISDIWDGRVGVALLLRGHMEWRVSLQEWYTHDAKWYWGENEIIYFRHAARC